MAKPKRRFEITWSAIYLGGRRIATGGRLWRNAVSEAQAKLLARRYLESIHQAKSLYIEDFEAYIKDPRPKQPTPAKSKQPVQETIFDLIHVRQDI